MHLLETQRIKGQQTNQEASSSKVVYRDLRMWHSNWSKNYLDGSDSNKNQNWKKFMEETNYVNQQILKVI